MPKFRILDAQGKTMPISSMSILGRHIIADKTGVMEMTMAEAVVASKSYHIVGQDGSELAGGDIAAVHAQADAYAKEQARLEAERKQQEMDEATRRLEAAAAKTVPPVEPKTEDPEKAPAELPRVEALGLMKKDQLLAQSKTEGVTLSVPENNISKAQIVEDILKHRASKQG